MWTRPAHAALPASPKALELSWRPLCDPGQRPDVKTGDLVKIKIQSQVRDTAPGGVPTLSETPPCSWDLLRHPLPSPTLSPHPRARALVNLQKSVFIYKAATAASSI